MELQLQHLSKCYGAKQAVNDVSTVLTPGVYGLLGANGAGKTTLMRMICGVLKPTSGSICLNGKSIDELGEDYYAHLGYMPQDFGFYPDFTAREFMLYMAAVKGLDRKEATTRTGELLKLVNLHEVADKKINSYCSLPMLFLYPNAHQQQDLQEDSTFHYPENFVAHTVPF